MAYGRTEEKEKSDTNQAEAVETEEPPHGRYYPWAELMKRTFGLDVLSCPHCGGRLKLISLIEDPKVIKKILDHLGLPTAPPGPIPARAPPELDLFGGDACRPSPTPDDCIDDPNAYAE